MLVVAVAVCVLLLVPPVPSMVLASVTGALPFYVDPAIVFDVKRAARIDMDDHPGRGREVSVDADVYIGAWRCLCLTGSESKRCCCEYQ